MKESGEAEQTALGRPCRLFGIAAASEGMRGLAWAHRGPGTGAGTFRTHPREDRVL